MYPDRAKVMANNILDPQNFILIPFEDGYVYQAGLYNILIVSAIAILYLKDRLPG